MRTLLVAFGLLAVSISLSAQRPEAPATPPQAQDQPGTPTFRAGVNVIAVDVGVTDSRGRPVEDLLAPDFLVRIDGQERRVISAELVKIDVEAGRRRAENDAFDPVFTTNQTPRDGRLFMLAIDQSHVRPGTARGLLQAAGRFLDTLSPADRVAFLAYPPPGAAIGFTNDWSRIKRAMDTVVGSRMQASMSRLNLGIAEAIEIAERNDERLIALVASRECPPIRGTSLEDCEREIVIEATQIANRIRMDREHSLRSLSAMLQDLVRLDGAKTLVLMSEGIILDRPGDLDGIIEMAGLGQVSVHALQLDVSMVDTSIARRPVTRREDRQLEISGLANLASATRGSLYQVVGTGDNIFEQIGLETSAFYLLGVEEAATDRDGKRHRIDVEVRRRNVTLNSRRAFVLSSASTARRSVDERLVDALQSPFGVSELPIRATTFVTQDTVGDKVRLMVAAEVGVAGSAPGPYVLGYAMFDGDGHPVVAFTERQTLDRVDGRPTAPLAYSTTVLVDPGTYSLRLAAIDPDGRRGSVVRTVQAWRMTGESFTFGDLFVGNVPESGLGVRAAVEPHIDGGAVAAFVDLYSTEPDTLADAEVTFELAADEESPALMTARGTIVGEPPASSRTAQAIIEAAMLPPGRYIARARIRRAGKPAGVLIRPIVLGTLRPGAMVYSGPINLGTIATFERSAVLAPQFVNGMIELVVPRGPALRAALVHARAGRYGLAALEALSAGDQAVAQLLQGLDHYVNGQLDQAATQLNIAAGPRREFFPAAFYLGAVYAEAGQDREAAGVWQLSIGDEPRPPAVYVLFADARFRAGQPESVIEMLEPAYYRTPEDEEIARRLGLAYAMVGRNDEAVPILERYLTRNGTDADALFAAIYAYYDRANRTQTLPDGAERGRLERYASAYRGPHQALVERYLQSLSVR